MPVAAPPTNPDPAASTAPMAAATEGVQSFTDFIQAAPVAGASPSRRTEVRLSHDGQRLHLSVRAYDDQPKGIVARQMRRDELAIRSEDHVAIVIDAEGAGRNGYLFAVNALGAQFDALVYDGGEIRTDWDALWRSEAHVEADGWRAEIDIPLAVFGRAAKAGVWRFNVERWMPRGSERVRLAAAQPDKEVYTLGDAIRMAAIEPAREGWGLRLKPSVRLSHESASVSGTGEARTRLAPALEFFHETRFGMRTTGAVNIDFGDAEVDERLVNLTRFELFRPEKREFFYRDAGRFTFGGLGESVIMPYYSRRIGLDAQGVGRVLDGGLKITGSTAGFDYGGLAARVAGGPVGVGLPEQAAADVAVARLARPIGERHRIGLIATRGNPSGTSGSSLWGADYQFRDTAFMGSRTLEANVWAMQSSNANRLADGGERVGRAWGGRVSHVNVGPIFDARWTRVGQDFDPALGYLAESNVLRGSGSLGWWHRTPDGTDIVPGMDWSYRRTLDGQERSTLLNPEVEYTTAAGDSYMAEWVFETDRLVSGYSPVPGVQLNPGAYSWNYFFGYFETAQSRPVWLEGEVRAGGYYDGRRNDQSLALGWKPAPQWGVRVGLGRNAVGLPGARYTVKLATLRLDYTPSTQLTQSLLLQWDNVSGELGVSARLRWWWAVGREVVFALDRVGYTGTRSQIEPGQTRAMLKFIWNIER